MILSIPGMDLYVLRFSLFTVKPVGKSAISTISRSSDKTSCCMVLGIFLLPGGGWQWRREWEGTCDEGVGGRVGGRVGGVWEGMRGGMGRRRGS